MPVSAAARAADDEVCLDDSVHWIMWWTEERVDGGLSHLGQWLGDGCQRRPAVGGIDRPIERDDGDILGHLQAGLKGCFQNASTHLVGADEQRPWNGTRSDKALHRLVSAAGG